MGDDPVRQTSGFRLAHMSSDSLEYDALQKHKELLHVSASVREMSLLARRMSGTARENAQKLREENGLMRQKALRTR